MDFYVFVVLVILITAAAGAFRALRSTAAVHDGDRRKRVDDHGGRDALVVENQELKKQISAMESRIRVLERITTDSASRTAMEIESLR